MAKKLEADVAAVGAGTAGSYLAWKLALAGFDCVVLEKESLEGLGTSIGPFHMEEVAFDRLDIPPPEGDELLHRENRMAMFSPGGEAFHFELPIMVMDKPSFMRRLHGYAHESGVRIMEGTEVTGPMLEDGYLRGVTARDREGELEVSARLVVDASGIDGFLRTRMPPGTWLETDPITDEDTIFVYMETWRDIEGDLRPGVSSYPYHQGWSAPGPGDTRIVGIGMTGSDTAAKERHRRFTSALPYRGVASGSTGGRVPYRRPPYSLVDNSLMVVGDSAFMNKPFSGEGVTSGLAACVIAADIASRALRSNDLTRESLWPYNTGYFRDQGAKFAFLTAVLPALMSMGEEEMDFFFGIPGLLTEEGSAALQLEYEVSADPSAVPSILGHLLRGMAGGGLRLSSLGTVAAGAVAASCLRSLYRRFPSDPTYFGPWVRAADRLWGVAERIRHRYFGGALQQ